MTGELLLRDVAVNDRRLDVLVVDEVIREVGQSLRPLGNPHVIDGEGGALIPGLHDHHVHLLAAAAARASVAVGPAEAHGLDGVAALLRKADASLAPGQWVRAVGYHDTVAGTLDRYTLDALVPHRPVRVQHRSGAEWILNTAAIDSLELEATSHAGAERDHNGHLTGRFHRADEWLTSRWPGLGPLDLVGIGAELASNGITGVTDATPFRSVEGLHAIADAAASGALPQRIMAMGGVDIAGSPFAAPLAQGPVKLVIDDAHYPSLDILQASISRAHAHCRPVAIHCVTRASLVLALAAWESAGSRDGDRIEHGSVIPPEVFQAVARLGLTVVTQPAFVSERGDQYVTDVDPADLPHLYRCRSLREAGIPVAASSDAPYTRTDPWAAMRAAATRRTAAGRVVGPLEAVSPLEALQMYLGHPDRPGGEPRRVAVGAPADLCLLDGPLPTEVHHLRADRVGTTIVAGSVVTTGMEHARW